MESQWDKANVEEFVPLILSESPVQMNFPDPEQPAIITVRQKEVVRPGRITKTSTALIAVLAIFLIIALWEAFKDPKAEQNKIRLLLLNETEKRTATDRNRCGTLKSQDVWTLTLPKLLTESAIRMLDVNKDGLDDVIMGFATGGDGYNVPDIICDIYFGGLHPCFGGVLALDGATGAEIWRVYTVHEVFALNCNADFNGDGQKDCLAGGRAAVFLAIDTVAGKVLWTVKVSNDDLSNFYTPQIIYDLNADGVAEILVSHGGDPLRVPGKQVHVIGLLLILDGRTGHILNSIHVPDGGETYYSPQIYSSIEGTQTVLFGTGGETHGGSLWAINLLDLIKGNGSQAVRLLSDPYKGIMVPPVLVDITSDGTVDIVMALYNSSVIAIDGRTFQEIWRYTTTGSETYNTPAAGFFNEDDVPDFFVKYSVGPGYPIYYYAESTILDGKTGKPLLTEPIRDLVGSQSSPLSISVQGGRDLFIYWQSGCKEQDVTGDLRYKFTKGTRIHEQSRADFCKLRFRTEGVSQMYVFGLNDQVPGWKIYDSEKRKESEHRNWVNTTTLAETYLELHPDWKGISSHTNGKSRERRHVGPHDGDGIQRLISTGSLTDSFGEEKSGAIDFVFATYWFFPAKTTVVLPEDQACIDRNMSQEEDRFNTSSRYYGMDHDAFENTVEEECLSRRSNHPVGERGESYRDLFQLKMGSMTVFRIRLRCSENVTFLPMDQQHWAAYMGTDGTGLFHL